MSTMVENSKKGKSGDKSKSTKSAPITNGVKSTIKKQRKSLQDNVVQMVKKVVSRKKVSVEPENSSSQENGDSSHQVIESDNINTDETVQESTGALKRVLSRKRKTLPHDETHKQAKTDSEADNIQNNIPVLVESKKDAEEILISESNTETSHSLKKVQSSRIQNLSSIGEEEESSKSAKPSKTKSDKFALDDLVQENSHPLKRNPSSRRKNLSVVNGGSGHAEPAQATLDISKASRVVKRVPSRKGVSVAPNEIEETVQSTSDAQDNPSSGINIPKIHIKSGSDKTEVQPKSKTSSNPKRVSSIRRTNSKKGKNVETNSSSGDIPESSNSEENVPVVEVKPENNNDSKPESAPESSISLKGVSSPRKRKAPVVKEKSKTAAKSTQLAVTAQEPSTSQRGPQTAKRQKLQELPVPPINSIHGTVFVMGENEVGQLGLSPDDMDRKNRPFQLELPYSIVEIAAGGMHSVCLTTNGEVITFGCNDEGALGRITDEESPEYVPKKVDIPERIVQISAADSHTAALAESGQVYIWGNFRRGDGAMGLTRNGLKQTAPMKILQGEKIVMISSGSEHLICLSSNGVVYSCGASENGQLGRLSSRNAPSGGRGGIANLVEPAQLFVTTKAGRSPSAVYMDKIWTGAYNTFLREQGTGAIYACGLNNYDHLGFSSTEAVFLPKKVESFNNNVWQYVHGGMHHTLTLDESGKVYSIGRKEYGRLGLGENCDDAKVPTIIPTLEEEKCIDISCGDTTSYAVTEEGSAFSWGFGTSYQLGHGNDADCFIPTKIAGRFQDSWKAIRISGGGQHALILACRK